MMALPMLINREPQFAEAEVSRTTRLETAMSKYTFAMSYFDRSDEYSGLLLVHATGDNAEEAWDEVERSKGDQEWLLTAFGGRDQQDITGVVVGEHVLIGIADSELGEQLNRSATTR